MHFHAFARRCHHRARLQPLIWLSLMLSACSPQPPAPTSLPVSTSLPASTSLEVRPAAQEAGAITSYPPVSTHSGLPAQSKKPLVLFDSFHAHNFLDRGLTPGEHTYHHYTGLRRAANMLSDRQVEVRELIVGPITSERLKDVRLIVLNLPSMDRPPWMTAEIDAVERFIREGGGIIFVTDHSNCYYHQYHLLPLWQRLGLIPTFETTCERTTKNLLSRQGPAWLLIRDFEKHPVTDGIRFFGMQTGGRVVGDGIIGRTSPDAWADAGLSPLYGEGNVGLTGDLRYSESELSGAQGTILAKSIDRGRVVVICDQNALGDAQISYADNWRLWLNACNWAGQLQINTNPLTIDKIAALQADKQALLASRDDSQPAHFDELVGVEPDRNASPTLLSGSWQVECWEDLSGGNFYWGGDDREQYYYFWCWLNRWCWASAHEVPSNPAPSGRNMLLVTDTALQLAGVKQRVLTVLRQNGKVVLLATSPPATVDVDNAAKETTVKQTDHTAWLSQQTGKLFNETESRALISSVAWRDKPLIHAQITVGGGHLVVLPDTKLLQNSNFTAPETAPNSVRSKWQRQLYHWLFEQP